MECQLCTDNVHPATHMNTSEVNYSGNNIWNWSVSKIRKFANVEIVLCQNCITTISKDGAFDDIELLYSNLPSPERLDFYEAERMGSITPEEFDSMRDTFFKIRSELIEAIRYLKDNLDSYLNVTADKLFEESIRIKSIKNGRYNISDVAKIVDKSPQWVKSRVIETDLLLKNFETTKHRLMELR